MDYHERFEWVKKTGAHFAESIEGISDWQYLKSASIHRKHVGDLHGAIEAAEKAVGILKASPNMAERAAITLNFLADLYLLIEKTDEAEKVLTESITLCRERQLVQLPDDLLMLARVLCEKGDYQRALTSVEEARRLHYQQGHYHGVREADNMIGKLKGKL